MRTVTVEPEEIFDRSNLPQHLGTPLSSTSFRDQGRGTTALSSWQQPARENLLSVWRDLIEDVLGQIFRKAVAEYVERYFESADEVESFRYTTETITVQSVARLKTIREKKFGGNERFVIYTPEELRDFF